MADAWARTTGTPGVVTVDQVPGLTNAMTGSPRRPRAVPRCWCWPPRRRRSGPTSTSTWPGWPLPSARSPSGSTPPGSALADAHRAYSTALGRRTVVLALPLDVQAAQYQPAPGSQHRQPGPVPALKGTFPSALAPMRSPSSGRAARGPAAGVHRGPGRRGPGGRTGTAGGRVRGPAGHLRGGQGAVPRQPLEPGRERGFALPLAAELISDADVIVGWGCSLSMWTTRHGRPIPPEAALVQVDDDVTAIGAHRPVHLGVIGDVAETARAVAAALGGEGKQGTGYRSAGLRERIADRVRWRTWRTRTRAAGSGSTRARCRSRWITCCPRSGPWRWTPELYGLPEHVPVRARRGGLRLHSGVPVHPGRPGHGHRGRDRPPGPAGGRARRRRSADGVSELETIARLGLPIVVAVYDYEAYGAEAHPTSARTATRWIPCGSRRPTSPRSPAGSASKASWCVRQPTSPRCATGWTARAGARCSSTPRSRPRTAPGGWKRPSAGITDCESPHRAPGHPLAGGRARVLVS